MKRIVTAGSMLLGLQWLWAAGGKLVDPFPAYEFAARLLGGGLAARSALTLTVLLETLLGCVMMLRVRRGLRSTLALLAVFSAGLLVVRSRGGGHLACGCYSAFGTTGVSVDGSLLVNGGLAAVAVVLLGLEWRLRSSAS